MTRCCVCGEPGKSTTRILGDKLRIALFEYFGSAVPAEVRIRDYDLLSCRACGLVSTVPMEAGDDDFYQWITRQSGYYPAFRWEWRIVIESIRRLSAQRPISVLDVGCGSGDFLSTINEIPGVDARGIDTTASSVQAGRARGLNIDCADMARYAMDNPNRRFDVVTSFHCIEHVSDPKGFLSAITSFLKPDIGVALVSAPLSPMSFETKWFDPLNHPPHHLTRWSLRALQELSKAIGLELSIETSPARLSVFRALEAFELEKKGALKSGRRLRQVWVALRGLPEFIQEWAAQSRRPMIDGRVIGNIFLAAFSRPGFQFSLRNERQR